MTSFSDSIRQLLTGTRYPSRHDIDRHQKLLAMYRGLLAEYLRQRQQWPRTEVPEYLSTGIDMLRGHILNTRGTLRGWKVAIADHADDTGHNDDIGGEVAHQRELLKIHRRNLAICARQHEQFPSEHVPATVIHSIELARNEIGRIKAILRGLGAVVDDLPGEEIEQREDAP